MENIKLYGTAIMGTKGQVVIPAEARKALALNEGEKFFILQGPHAKSLIILKSEVLKAMLGRISALSSEITSITESDSKKINPGGKNNDNCS